MTTLPSGILPSGLPAADSSAPTPAGTNAPLRQRPYCVLDHSSQVMRVNQLPRYRPVSPPRDQGSLRVSDIHTLFYAVYGNPNGFPVVVLHGGPGNGLYEGECLSFDLKRWNVVMFDQRGTGRSTPFASMEENTTQHSIEDIETLRRHLRIEQWAVFGVSWGSTLAVLYGQQYPSSCSGFILGGIFLGQDKEYLRFFNENEMGAAAPEAYASFRNSIPPEEQGDLLNAYYRRIMDPNPDVQREIARQFMRYDISCAVSNPHPHLLEARLRDERTNLSIARAFLHYSSNHFFLEPNQILSNMDPIKHLPAIIINGEKDLLTPPETAHALYQNWDNSNFLLVADAGHDDAGMATVYTHATDFLASQMPQPVPVPKKSPAHFRKIVKRLFS